MTVAVEFTYCSQSPTGCPVMAQLNEDRVHFVLQPDRARSGPDHRTLKGFCNLPAANTPRHGFGAAQKDGF